MELVRNFVTGFSYATGIAAGVVFAAWVVNRFLIKVYQKKLDKISELSDEANKSLDKIIKTYEEAESYLEGDEDAMEEIILEAVKEHNEEVSSK